MSLNLSDFARLAALLPIALDGVKLAQEVGSTDTLAVKIADAAATLAVDVPRIFQAFGASAPLVEALGNQALYADVAAVVEAIIATLPALEAVIAKQHA